MQLCTFETSTNCNEISFDPRSFSEWLGGLLSKILQIVDIMLPAVSIGHAVKYFDIQAGYDEVIARFCRGSPLGFAALIKIQSLPLQCFKSSAYKYNDCNIYALYSILSEDLAKVTK